MPAKKIAEQVVIDLETATAEAKEYVDIIGERGLDVSLSDYDEMLGEAHTTILKIEAVKEFQTRPLKDAYDKAVKPYNEAVSLWKKVKDLAKDFLSQHAIANNKKDELALEAAVVENDTKAVARVSAPAQALQNAKTKIRYTFRVVDARLVPDKYCIKTVNLHLVENAVDDGIRQIPGIEIYPKADVRVANKKKDE